MEERNVYKDISQRTGGDIYIGVVGPVRSGKSTFIKKFMDELVIPNISSESIKERTVDELPQSSGGRTIMTTEPKFVPEEAVEVNLNDNASFKVRMIDCVGYIVPSAVGYIEEDQPRMVKTPWVEEEIPFNMAAEIGTKKVINEHSTIGLVVTTDGSISEIPREEYEEVEERVISELKQINKPFAVLLNSANANSPETIALSKKLSNKYGVPVIPMDGLNLNENEIKRILANVLFEFPIKEIAIQAPRWLNYLETNHWLRKDVYSKIEENAKKISKISDIKDLTQNLNSSEFIESSNIENIDLGKGQAKVKLKLKNGLFYKILGEKTKLQINNEGDLLASMLELSEIKSKFEKINDAYESAIQTDYGIVMPSMNELTLDEPEIIKQGGKYGIRLKASAPSLHIMKTNITTEVTPIVGSQQQSQELINYLLTEFEEEPGKIWESNIFGKSLYELVYEGLNNKLARMPNDARVKVKETIERIINDGCNGLICIIL